MKVTEDIFWVGVNDRDIDLFEGQYPVENGMAYNSYLIKDGKSAVLDTVSEGFFDEWMKNIKDVLGEEEPDYLVIHHMEPDHSANIDKFMSHYKSTKIVSDAKSFKMMKQFFGNDYSARQVITKEGDKLSLGKHELSFYGAPMVHWPEVLVSYDSYSKTLFSADAFGKFGTTDAEEDWACEARRYYFGIVGKYGKFAGALLEKASTLEIERICALHGPVLSKDLPYYINLYKIWTSYMPEDDDYFIAYTSVYGNTEKAVLLLEKKLYEFGAKKVVTMDLARCDMTEAVEEAFRQKHLVLATTTYNGGIFPFMQTFLHHLEERSYQNRVVALMENGSWAPAANRIMKNMLSSLKDITFCEEEVSIKSALCDETILKISALAKELISR